MDSKSIKKCNGHKVCQGFYKYLEMTKLNIKESGSINLNTNETFVSLIVRLKTPEKGFMYMNYCPCCGFNYESYRKRISKKKDL